MNPQWAKLLDVLGMNVEYVRCDGAELTTGDGRRILDANAGYCVHAAGHNHPRIVAALKAELDRHGPAMLQGHVPALAGELGARLVRLAGGRIAKVFFTSSGSEGVEAAIKFARTRTGRVGILAASGAFHGLTCGALSLMDTPYWTEGFGPMLPETRTIPFGDLAALETALATRRYAAFVVEPIQAEGGVRLPPPGYLADASRLCRRHGTLLVLDEVQTGLHRTGPFLAAHREGVEPDMVVLAKALSGGLVPVGALLLSDEVYDAVFTSFKRAFVHASTYGENGLAMRAGLATLDVLEEERLGERAEALGERLRARLSARLAGSSSVAEVRGAGLLVGVEFRRPRELRLRLLFDAFARIHPGMFGQVLVMRLFKDHGVYAQICGNDFRVLKLSPALTLPEDRLETIAAALAGVVASMRSTRYWTEALGMARRALEAR